MLTAGLLKELIEHERPRVLAWAHDAMAHEPQGITANICPRSPGSANDYYSEAPYSWPDPSDAKAPYITHDGDPWPDRFMAHQRAVSDLNTTVGALVAGRLLTAKPAYAGRAIAHLQTWFINPATRMNPHLTYSQAKGNICTGSPPGIIDAKHLVETAKAIECLAELDAIEEADLDALRHWYRQLLTWLDTHDLSLSESRKTNNHAIYWTILVAACACLNDDQAKLAMCRDRYRDLFVGQQMADDGSFPREINRTRPLGYSIFALNGMAILCQMLSTPDENLWACTTPDGRGMKLAMEYLYPTLADTSQWPHHKDIDDFELMPGRPIALLLAGLAYDQPQYRDLWLSLTEPDPQHDWHNRAVCFRQPVLWLPMV